MALNDIQVVEFAGLAPAPFAGLVLADWGAEVIRVDRPGSRSVDSLCRHKRSITLDVKNIEALDVLRRLLAKADVLIDPFRPGVMERLGLGPEVFLGESGLNKRLVYARIAGFSPNGPQKDAAGHDINYLALSGVLSMLPGDESRPVAPLNLVADFGGGGLLCALGIVIALLERQKSGLGQVVSNDMVSGTRYLSTFALLPAMRPASNTPFSARSLPESPPATSKLPTTRMSHMLDGGAPFYNIYTCSDGRWMSVGCLEPRFYAEFLRRFLQAIPTHFLENEPVKLRVEDQYKTQLWPQTRSLFQRAFKLFDRDYWTAVFINSDACTFPVLNPAEAAVLASDSQKADGMMDHSIPLPHPRLSRTPARLPDPTHHNILQPGQHTHEILAELGYSQQAIDHLVSCGAFGDHKSTRAKL